MDWTGLLGLRFVTTATGRQHGMDDDANWTALWAKRRRSPAFCYACDGDEWMTCDDFKRRWTTSLMADEAFWLPQALILSGSYVRGGRMEDGSELWVSN
ncbi:uncharacterized protein DS421_13g406520 [Arachis hypogaea]|nr:uncharacterized protein DS421_13g406520 [Arachis hypogaea]